MRFTPLLAVLAAPFLVVAQSNSFDIPSTGLSGTAGQTLNLKWNPTTSGTVSLILRSGASSNLEEGSYIAQGIQNSGSYAWSVPSDVVRGSDYTVEIVSDSDSSQSNFTPYFVIDSTNTVKSVTMSTITQGAPTATVSQSTAAATGSASTVTASGNSASGSSASGSAISSATGSASSGSASRSATSSGAGFQSTSGSAAAASQTGSAPRATAAAGMMAIVALGALAL